MFFEYIMNDQIENPKTWFLYLRLQASSDAKDAGNGITNSTLTFTPTMSRDKKSLVCRAENPVLQNSIKTDEGRLHILCRFSYLSHLFV